MRILIIKSGKYPTPEASSKRLSNYIKALRKGEYEVEVKTVDTNAKTTICDLLGSYFIPFLAFHKTISQGNQPSIVMVYGFGWLGKASIIAACKFRKWPVILELNELPYSIHGGSRRDLVFKYFDRFNEFMLQHLLIGLFDGFIVISDQLYKYIHRYKKDKAIILKVPILVDYSEYQKKVCSPPARMPYIINTARTNDHKDGIINVFRAFSMIRNKYDLDLHFYLTSTVIPLKLKLELKKIIDSENLGDSVTFLGDLEEEELLNWQAHCTFVVLNKVDSIQNRYNFATKLGEYMALGKPIITTSIGEVKNYLRHNISCIYVDPTNPAQIAEEMYRLIVEPQLAAKIGLAGKEIAKNNFDYQVQSTNICKFFKEFINN